MASGSQPGPSSSGNGIPGLDVGHAVPSSGADNATAQAEPSASRKKKRRGKRGGKPKGERRSSFSVPQMDSSAAEALASSQDALTGPRERPFYKLGHATGGNLSNTSLESEALLDHREQMPMRPRRDSRLAFPGPDMSLSWRASYSAGNTSNSNLHNRRQRTRTWGRDAADDEGPSDTRTPLLGGLRQQVSHRDSHGYGLFRPSSRDKSHARSHSPNSSLASRRERPQASREMSGYDVNNPPSVPGTPLLGAEGGLDDVMVTEPYASQTLSLSERRKSAPGGEQLIDIDGDAPGHALGSTPPTPRGDGMVRRHTLADPAEADVCFPAPGLSEIAEEDYVRQDQPNYQPSTRRRRLRKWPDFDILDDWSREEKEERSDGIRAKKISEPVLVDGRLRPIKRIWHRAEEDAPYRFTYFNEVFQSTVHSQTISELLQEGQSFTDLFTPNPPELSDSSSDEEDGLEEVRSTLSPHGGSVAGTRHSSIMGEPAGGGQTSDDSGKATPSGAPQQQTTPNGTVKPKRYGNRPIFWLDVLSPTDTEMRVISKAFGIHPLTAEDIMMQEAREKVELFHNYYLVNYRTFEQDVNSEDYLEPINMYVVVFREGVISFHFSMTPHPANVRRRIRQLKDYLELTADWVSYAIIDDITDVFAPLIQTIEDEVDEIDDAILQLHTTSDERASGGGGSRDDRSQSSRYEKGGSTRVNSLSKLLGGNKGDAASLDEKRSTASDAPADSGGNMLRRVGEGRKKVMGIYRLIGNKADVIKGFAKRCNEQWDIAPRSDIGLYLGDIQDHVLTMTSSLNHYETLLSRAHSNYLAQINIRMNERQEQTADVLGKLTVLGTIVLPMNIITGMWGMNVLVPGQDADNLYWFWSITAGLLAFGFSCFFIAKKVYGIV